MLTQRKEGAEKLEGMAKSKGLKFTGLKNMKTSSKIALVILVAVVLISILAPIIAPYDPYAIGMARQAPDAAHIFGTDDKGRDILSRILYGGRISLVIGFGSVLFALVLGSIVGALAAVSRKAVSEVIMRILDIIMSVPGIALAAVLVTILGNSVPAIIFSIGFMYTPQIARIVRANIVSEYGEDYVRAVIVSGARAPWILDEARPAQLRGTHHGLHRDARGRRHHLRGVPDVPLCRHRRAHAHLGQHPCRRPRRRAVWPLVAGALPGHRHHAYLPGP